MSVRKVILFLVGAAILILILALLRRRLDNEVLLVKIISPYNCEYELSVNRKSFSTSSVSKSFQTIDSAKYKVDTLLARVDTLINDNDRSALMSIVSSIKNIDVDSIRAKDAYVFKLYVDDKLMIMKNGSDPYIFSLLHILKPYIRQEEIQCCDFFRFFENPEGDTEKSNNKKIL